MDANDHRSLGRLEAKLDHLIEENKNARSERKLQYERQEKTDSVTAAISNKVDRIEKRLEAVEEPVAQFNRWRERGIGAMMLVSFFGATIGALLTKYWAKIVGTVL